MTLISIDKLRSKIGYDPITGHLHWRVSNGSQAARNSAGWNSHKGYLKVRIERRNYYAHRIAWALHHGEWPSDDVDHINGNKGDNRISNLRAASRTQNLWNMEPGPRNKSGAKGVCWHKQSKKWRAYIFIDGRQKSLGLFDTVVAAAAAYDAAVTKVQGEFAVPNKMMG